MELKFERVLPKEDQMEMCKQLGLAGARGVWGGGGKGNNVREKLGFSGGLAR